MTYAANAQPIYKKYCGSCHGGDSAGGSNFATVYADTQAKANAAGCSSTMTVGACTLVRIQNGSMPKGAGCSGNPTTDKANTACLTAANQTVLQQWISGGQKP